MAARRKLCDLPLLPSAGKMQVNPAKPQAYAVALRWHGHRQAQDALAVALAGRTITGR
jgi:hypothetical protein